MLHHYGRCFPRIYSSPIQPVTPRTHDPNEKTYLDFIRDDLEDNQSLDLLTTNKSFDCSVNAAFKDKETQTDLCENEQQQKQNGSRSIVEILRQDKLTQTNWLEDANIKMRFTREEDQRILRAIKTHEIKQGPNQKNRIKWDDIKRTSNLFQHRTKLKARYNKIIIQKGYTKQTAALDTAGSLTVESVRGQHYEIVPRLLNSVKIDRIATALNNATQREYFDYTFFESLPAKIGTQERWEDLKRFYFDNLNKIVKKLDETAKERFLLDEYYDFEKKCTLLHLYSSQRKKLEQMQQSSQLVNLSKRNITGSRRCKRPNNNQEADPKIKCLRLSGPLYCLSSKSRAEPEWKYLLNFISKREVYSLINETRFWDNVPGQLKTSISKTGQEFKKDFYTKIVPSRNDENWIRLPKLKLQPDTEVSKLIIFHEINKTGVINDSIQQLISDELLSDEFSIETWFEKFALEIKDKDHNFFLSNECEFQVLKESVRLSLIKKAFAVD